MMKMKNNNIKNIIATLIIAITMLGCNQGKEVKKYDNGVLIASHYEKNGKAEGLAKLYFPNGKVELEGEYKNGVPNGKFVFYYENGNIRAIAEMKDSKNHGVAKFYDKEGLLEDVEVWEEGEMLGRICE